jgi:hypothetical protein
VLLVAVCATVLLAGTGFEKMSNTGGRRLREAIEGNVLARGAVGQ